MRADGPVVVLAAAINVVEGLLLEERREAVLGRGFFDDLHHDQILVDLRRRRAEEGRELVLVRRDLAVARAQRDAETCVEIKILRHVRAESRVVLHAIDAMSARWRGC